jgi:HK97 family phage portal protein
MNIIQRYLNRAVNNALKEVNKNNQFYKATYGNNFGGPYDQIGNPDDPLDYGYNVNTTVYSIVRRVTKAATRIPFCLVDKDGEKIFQHPILDLLERPNEMQGHNEFFEHTYGFKMLTGNSFIYAPMIDSGKFTGQFTQMHILPSNHVEIIGGEWFDPIRGYRLSQMYNEQELSKEKVLHMKYANFDYDNGQEFYGLSPIQVGLNKLKKEKRRDELQYKNYANSGAQGIVFDKTQDRVMMVDQQDRMQRSINNRLKNLDNKVAYMIGELGYLELGMNASEMQMLEDAKFTIKDLCNLFNVPSVLFGDESNAKYNNVREAKADLYLNAAIPEVESFCHEFNRQWMPAFEKDLYLWFDTSNIEELQKDKREQVEWLSKAAFIRENEKREIMGFEPDDELEGIGFMYPQGVMPLAQMEAMNAMMTLNDGEA